MATISVSFNNTTCTVGCNNLETGKGSGVQWTNDRTVTSFTISNISPLSAFATLPTQANGWSGTLAASWMGTVNYDISVIPAASGNCTSSSRQKAPSIQVKAK